MKNICQSTMLVLIAVFSINMFSGCSTDNTYSGEKKRSIAQKKYSLIELQSDFNQLKEIIEHQNPKLFADKQELSDIFESQYTLLQENMGLLDFYRIVSPIISKVRCGHTNLSIPYSYYSFMRVNAKYLPFKFFISDKRLFITENISDMTIPVGSEILSTNGVTSDEIINKLLNNLTADGQNETHKYYMMNNWFNSYFYYYIDNSDTFKIAYLEPNELKENTISVNSSSKIDEPAMRSYFQAGKEHEQYEKKIETNYAVLTIKTFKLHDKENYQKFLQDFFMEIDGKKIKNLILDLRGNWGGDPYCSSKLLSYLIYEPVQYFNDDMPSLSSHVYSKLTSPMPPAQSNFKGNLYTLINGGCFSSTGHLCSLLKYHKIGKFIGSETGGSYVCTDGSKDITLQYTHLGLRYSTTPFKTEVTGLEFGRGIIPDYKINKTIEDVLLHKDVEMATALKLLNIK